MKASRHGRRLAGRTGLALLLAGAGGSALASAVAQPTDQDLAKLASMSLEELLHAEVTTVAGTPHPRMATPAALTVITAEDIRRSGHRSVAEALRLVPGMYVGRINAASWVAGARGLTGTSLTSNRYLVLVDGRLVHDPLLSTTFWDTVDVPLPDLDRIEVIRGPGATLWGVNAMNGVVNIITKRAEATQGTLLQAGAGSTGDAALLVRHGGTRGETAWRAWASYGRHGDFEDADGRSIVDQWSSLHGGFRVDGALAPEVTYTLQGDAYTHPRAMESVLLPVPGVHQQTMRVTRDDIVEGGNLLFRATSGFVGDRGWMLRAYYDHTRRDSSRFGVTRDTVDLEYRRWLDWSARNELIWGVQYDHTRDQVDNGPVLRFDPPSRGWSTLNAFVQNTTELVDDRLFFMAGSKFTEHSFVGFQMQPSVRLWWTPSGRQTWWAAVSRPIRAPSRFEEDGVLVFGFYDVGVLTTGVPNGQIVELSLSGKDRLPAEKLLAWELGHRIQLGDRWAIDSTLYYNDYRQLIGVPQAIFGQFTEAGSGATWGGSLSVAGQVTDRWRLQGSYSVLRTRIDGPIYQFEETGTPERLAQLHSWLDIGDAVELNASLYHVDKVAFTGIPAYTRADLGLAWRAHPGVELSLWGQNLLDRSHTEASGAQVPRGVYAQVTVDLGR
jgi:iron complex outermembrane receptor protein